MYLHVGSGRVIREKNILGIFDLDTASVGDATKEYLKAAENDGCLETVGEEIPKSFAVCIEEAAPEHRKNGKFGNSPKSVHFRRRVVMTQFSTPSLRSRSWTENRFRIIR